MTKVQSILLMMALVLAPVPVRSASDDILRDYMPHGRLIRFEGPVTYWIDGQGRVQGQSYVEAILAELSRILPNLPMQQANSRNQAAIRIALTDSDQEWQDAVIKSNDEFANWK